MTREISVRGNTVQLYDKGEEAWPHKFHLGCGNIYLLDYVNVDIVGELASERPDLLTANATTVTDYYSQRAAYTDIHHIPPRAEYLVDRRENMLELNEPEGSVDKFICVQTLEHVKPHLGELALRRWYEMLRYHGVLILSVPDTGATVEMLLDEKTCNFAIQHLAGTRKDKYSYHHNHFTPWSLELLLNSCGFMVEFLENFHRYPAIVVRAVKV